VRDIRVGADKLAGNFETRRRDVTTEIALPPHGWGILA
jgi:cyclomaltodextrinase